MSAWAERAGFARSGCRAGVVAISLVFGVASPWPSGAADSQAALVARGEYLARVGDCISCHTRPQGAPFAGGLPMATAFGTIVSTNITPDTDQGIGRDSEEDFARALREGKGRDGRHLYPAMPYTSFAKLSDADLRALYAYFMKGVAPAKQDNATTHLAWPFSMRGLMVGWNMLFLHEGPFVADPAQSEPWNRGAYLVQGLGHCGDCHTPRNRVGAVKGRSAFEGRYYLSGALIDGWYAQPLVSTTDPGIATWSTAEIATYLRTGRTDHTAAFGPMAQVVHNSTQYLSPEDLAAVATYLKDLDGRRAAAVTERTSTPDSLAMATATALQQGHVEQRGALVYLNNCAACHRSDGQGAQRTFPTLAGNSVVAAKDPTSLIRLVLQGSSMPHTTEAPSRIAMPGFGWRLSDERVADVLSFVRSGWGNTAAPVTAQDVATVRHALAATGSGQGADQASGREKGPSLTPVDGRQSN